MRRKPKLDFVNDEFNDKRHHPAVIAGCIAAIIAVIGVVVLI